MEFLDLTSLTLDEFEQLSPPFEAAFQAHMARWRLDGNRRTARRYSGKKKDPTVKKVWLVKAPLTSLFLSDTDGGRTHDKPIADATPYPLPAGSGLWQDLGFLGFSLAGVDLLMPTKKPRGGEFTVEEQLATQDLHHRRLRIEHVNSSVKRCRIVKDRLRWWKTGIRDMGRQLCCALHNFRVRLTPWQPMV
jgi:hypothetical protein